MAGGVGAAGKEMDRGAAGEAHLLSCKTLFQTPLMLCLRSFGDRMNYRESTESLTAGLPACHSNQNATATEITWQIEFLWLYLSINTQPARGMLTFPYQRQDLLLVHLNQEMLLKLTFLN